MSNVFCPLAPVYAHGIYIVYVFNVYQLGYKTLHLFLCHSSLLSSLKESIMHKCLSNVYFPGICTREKSWTLLRTIHRNHLEDSLTGQSWKGPQATSPLEGSSEVISISPFPQSKWHHVPFIPYIFLYICLPIHATPPIQIALFIPWSNADKP